MKAVGPCLLSPPYGSLLVRSHRAVLWTLFALLFGCSDVGVAPETFLAEQESEFNCPEEFDEDQCIVWDAAIAHAENRLSTPGRFRTSQAA